MDKVIFTGLVPLEEYKKDRPREYKELEETGKLDERIVKEYISPGREKLIKILGFTFLSIGVLLIILIIYSILFGYK